MDLWLQSRNQIQEQSVEVIDVAEAEESKIVTFFDVKGIEYIFLALKSSSSSSYRAGSTDIPDPLSPLLPIVHRPR